MVVASPPVSAWSYGGAMLTFLFPMILFLAVAGALYVLYTKPQQVPGSRLGASERPVAGTLSVAAAGGPASAASPGQAAPAPTADAPGGPETGQDASTTDGDGAKAGE
jgi:hypothetical protein